MKKILALPIMFGMVFGGIQSEAKAATWWLVVVADGKGSSDSEYSFQLPMEPEEQCEVAGTKLERSAQSGKFDKKGTDYMMYECVLGK